MNIILPCNVYCFRINVKMGIQYVLKFLLLCTTAQQLLRDYEKWIEKVETENKVKQIFV